MKTDNELIAEFMGLPLAKQMPSFGTSEWVDVPFQNWKYDTSWDWLMPVVEKIQELRYGIDITTGITPWTTDCEIYTMQDDTIVSVRGVESKVEAVYKAVVDFIKWYYENKTDNQ